MTDATGMPGLACSSEGPASGRRLVVIINGYTGTPNDMNDVVQAVREAYFAEPGFDIYLPSLDYEKRLSSTPAATIVSRLLSNMDVICNDSGRYRHIVLIGASMGAVFARRLFLAATDIHKKAPNEAALSNAGLRHWAKNVERIVTLGGLNRGWLVSGRLSWIASLAFNAVGLMGHLWPRAGSPTIFDVRRGAPFIVQTRLQWLALRRLNDAAKPEPFVIQLLGTQDDFVSPDDAIDFAVDRDRNSPYFYLELPHTRHENAAIFSPNASDRDGKKGTARKQEFIKALTGDRKTLTEAQIPAEYLVDALPPEPDDSVKHVAFIIHGIRDDGYWTRKVAQRIQEHAAKSKALPWSCITSSYGYFAMLPFVLPWIRRGKVEWLMDAYVGARARFPSATFSYVGHSNGTYLIARALEDYPAVQFRNVLFAGSVVRRDYDWNKLLSTNRIEKLLNVVATRDWVVAVFPMGLEPFRKRFDIGGAGFAGFNQALPAPTPSNLVEVRYVNGGHSAGLAETQWSKIAKFIVNGDVPTLDDPDFSRQQSFFWVAISKISTIVLLSIVLLVVFAPIYLILYPALAAGNVSAMEAIVRTLATLLYFFLLGVVVNKL
jgi:pimeloyl-ACP methyl ester carboxylesterase